MRIIQYRNQFFLFAVFVFFFTSLSPAMGKEPFHPVVIYQGSIDDNSFNYNIHEGIQRFVDKTGKQCTELIVAPNMEDYMKRLEQICMQGFSPIFLIYGNHIKGLSTFVSKYPDIRFLVLGQITDGPNILSFNFAEHEGSFLAGALAAMASKTDIIGFVSVSDLPLLRRFSCGYKQGAKYIKPNIKVLTGFTGDYEGAWFDSKATAAMANALMDQGADVIYQAAGGAGPAVLEAAAKRNKLGIGVDRNQNGLYPGQVLTSMLKRTDLVVFAALMHAYKGIWRDSIKIFGVVQNAVGLAFDEHNASLVSPDMRHRITAIKNKIALGQIKVHNYSTDNTCPYSNE